jgi:hypothetical protein
MESVSACWYLFVRKNGNAGGCDGSTARRMAVYHIDGTMGFSLSIIGKID